MRCLGPIESSIDPPTPPKVVADPGVATSTEPQASATTDDGISASGVPVVQLQVDSVTDVVAARLAIGLLGHVLFLKNQIPLPVPQLSRIPAKSSTTRGAKQRAELLASFDTLTSHLSTTFTAISLALYKSYSEEKLEKVKAERGCLDRAYLAVVLGPSLGTAKTRTFLAVDRFEVQAWGLREGSDENSKEDESDEESEGSEESETEDDEESEDQEDVDADTSTEEPDDSDEEDEADELSSGSESEDSPPLRESRQKPRQSTVPPIPSLSFAEEQKFLQNSERLLSRVLASADAEGYGFASEMAPTQAHILIRAPRRFIHPAWIPRQNITSSLESSLQDFLTRSRADGRESSEPVKRVLKKKQHSEGVWVTSKAGLNIPPSVSGETEEDEMIWWSWNGRISGFSDW